MNYKNLIKLIRQFNNNGWIRNVSKYTNFEVIFHFMNDPFFMSCMHSVICQSNTSHERWYKGQQVIAWFHSIIIDIHKGFAPLKALANNSKLPGYKKDKSHHRKLFYKIVKMIRVSLQRLFQCKTRQDFDSLNFYQPLNSVVQEGQKSLIRKRK